MAKATIVKIKSINENGVEVVTAEGKTFLVNSFDPMTRGALKITAPMGSMTIYELGKIVSGCFYSSSTFVNVNRVTFTFNTITVTVTLGEAYGNPDYVVSKWKKALNDDVQVKSKIEKFSTYLHEDIDD